MSLTKISFKCYEQMLYPLYGHRLYLIRIGKTILILVSNLIFPSKITVFLVEQNFFQHFYGLM